MVFFGSLARQEFTPDSDADWTLLVDGPAGAQHVDVHDAVRQAVSAVVAKHPGAEGTFGSITFSHDLVHYIGGEDDTNRNTTQRILLLLESIPASRRDAYDRVITAILQRYLFEDRRLWRVPAQFHVPRFLLNDFARYWRTVAVDFAYKRRSRQGTGAVLRNVKLRMSRKLLYVSALLTCFSCHEEFAASARREYPALPEHRAAIGVDYLRRQFSQTPLEVVANALLRHAHLEQTARKLFRSYDGFVRILADTSDRNRLNSLQPGAEDGDVIYEEARRLSHEFRDAVLALFFDEKSGLLRFTKVYGVF